MNDATNPNNKKGPAVQSNHQSRSDKAIRLALLQRCWVKENMFSFYPVLAVTNGIRKRCNELSLNDNRTTRTNAASRKLMTVLSALMLALACGNSASLAAEQESKQAVTVVVICDDAAAKKTIRDSLLTHFHSLQDLEVVDKNGYSSLIVYAEKTVNDPKNPNGYAIAIAHTNCYELKLAYQNLKGINDEKVRAVRTVAERALRDDTGILRHLNVAHLDDLSAQKLDDFTKRIVSDFHDRQKGMD